MRTVTGFHLPEDLGEFDIKAGEVMYYLYLPVSIPGQFAWLYSDRRLDFVFPLLSAVKNDMFYANQCSDEVWNNSYVYLTIKKMYVGGGVTANRPGWHCDGFDSSDLNYIWYDKVPTLFTAFDKLALSVDHNESLRQMELLDDVFRNHLRVYPAKHLLRLDDKVIHAVETNVPGQVMRTFVKITVSSNRFNLKDNSINPLLYIPGELYDRDMVRNDPHQSQRDNYTPEN